MAKAKEKKKPEWRNRIVGHGEEAPDQLLANPFNWRIHSHYQQQAMTGVLDEVGWVDEVIVNRTTGHILDGHLRVAISISRDISSVPVKYVELTEAEEKLILATFDPLGDLAVADAEVLDQLLEDVEAEDAIVDQMIGEMAAEAVGVMDTVSVEGGSISDRLDGYKRARIKPVIYAEDLALFERAIKLTGLLNRGDAVMEICRSYLELFGEEDADGD